MTREEIEKLWKDPRNYRWGVYYCKEDPRMIVPKGFKWMGWTINFAHPYAIPTMLLMITLVALPFAALQGAGPIPTIARITLAAVVLCAGCAWLSSRTK